MAIELDIQKNFKGFSLNVKLKGQNGTMGILGASGSGKSMTLRSIAGIETPDSGKIIINGMCSDDNCRPDRNKSSSRCNCNQSNNQTGRGTY